MDTITTSLTVAACVFTGGLIGINLHRFLPQAHQTKETQDVVRLGTGMLSVLASLVLGLLVATAKGSYDTTDNAIRGYAAELALLNETLRDYGASAKAPHELLRSYTEKVLRDAWPKDNQRAPAIDDENTGQLLEQVRASIRDLKPVDDGQKWLQEQALAINVNLLRQRWLLIEQSEPSVQKMVLIVLVAWISMIFVSFGLNAPRNATVITAFLISSLAIGGAVFLILEMDRPLGGVMPVSSWPMENVLSHMDW
jgi:hypothetical protein